MADLPIPYLVLNLLLMRGMAESPMHSHMLYIYLHVVGTFRDWKGTSAWKYMDLEHWIARVQRTGHVHILLSEEDLGEEDKLTYQEANYLSSLVQKHLVIQKFSGPKAFSPKAFSSREESNVHAATGMLLLHLPLLFLYSLKWLFSHIFLANSAQYSSIWAVTHSCRHRKRRSLGLSGEVLRWVLETCSDMSQKLQQCTSKWLQ